MVFPSPKSIHGGVLATSAARLAGICKLRAHKTLIAKGIDDPDPSQSNQDILRYDIPTSIAGDLILSVESHM